MILWFPDLLFWAGRFIPTFTCIRPTTIAAHLSPRFYHIVFGVCIQTTYAERWDKSDLAESGDPTKAMIFIREAIESDAVFLSKICLLTADAGKSAESLHDYEELPGLIFAVPYVKLPKTWGFVLEDGSTGGVVGYVLGTTDTRYFEQYAREHWWPPLAEKYSKQNVTKPADAKYISMLQNMFTASDPCIKFSPAHLHINILEQYQRKGWGRKLINTALEHLKREGLEAVWLGFGRGNEAARKFYTRLGFNRVEGAAENEFGLQF